VSAGAKSTETSPESAPSETGRVPPTLGRRLAPGGLTRLGSTLGNGAFGTWLRATDGAADPRDAIRAVLGTPGEPLEAATALAPDVRVHRDGVAERAADAANATAFTVGHHVVLGHDARDTSSSHGRQVLTHELAHVLQQRGAGSSLRLVPPNAPGEQAAARGEVGGPTSGGIARLVEKDLTRLDDEQLRAEYDLVTHELGQSSGADHEAAVAYVQEIDQEVSRRSASGAGAAQPQGGATCPCGGTIGPSGQCDRCAAAQSSSDAGTNVPVATTSTAGTATFASDDRAARIAENERLLQDPTLSPADVLRLNRERNALLAGDVSSQLPPQRDEATDGSTQPQQQVPVRVEYEAFPLDALAGSAGGLDLAGMGGAAIGGPGLGGGPGSFAGGGDADVTDPLISGGLATGGNALQRFVDPIPWSARSTGPNVFTRFAGRGLSDLTPELRTRLYSPTMPGTDLFDRAGISWGERIRLQQALRSRGAAAILAEEGELAALLRRVADIHAVQGGVQGSPLLSLTELLPEEALARLPPVATGRTYVVRVRIAPEDVIRVNELLGRTGRTANLANELEVVVAQDLAGSGAAPRIVSITANPAEGALLGGFRAGALRWGGRAMMVIGAAIAIHDVVTASGPRRREQEGRAFGSFAGATVLGAFGAGLCVGLGIATGGIALALCGLAFGAAGGFGGGLLGGKVGSWFD
jgi:hypothetical protein